MNRLFTSLASLSLLCATGLTFAAGYETPTGDAQFEQCQAYAAKLGWEGGGEKSPNAGQTKLVAFCSCMWHETPDDFRGNLALFAESDKGKKMNAQCEKYAGWGG